MNKLKTGALLNVIIVLGLCGVAYALYQKFFGSSDAEKAAKALAEKQLSNSQQVQGEITREVYKNTVGTGITREQANTIASSVYYYLNSIYFSDSDAKAILDLLFGINANGLRLVSEQFGVRELPRRDWIGNTQYDFKGAMIAVYGVTDFNATYRQAFDAARL